MLAGREAFADHHTFSAAELARLEINASRLDAVLVTTPKDAVRLPSGMTVHVVGVRLAWETEAAIESLLDELPVTDIDIQEVPIEDVIRQIFAR